MAALAALLGATNVGDATAAAAAPRSKLLRVGDEFLVVIWLKPSLFAQDRRTATKGLAAPVMRLTDDTPESNAIGELLEREGRR